MVRLSMAERRPLMFCATCGRTFSVRNSSTKLGGIVAFVGAERDRNRSVRIGFNHLQRSQPLGVTRYARHPGIDQQSAAVVHQPMTDETQLRLAMSVKLVWNCSVVTSAVLPGQRKEAMGRSFSSSTILSTS